jgi:geranylgeranyl reductase family protein
MKLYDAIVIGAGPAGSSAAHTLASGGARVLLLEKARIPRYKACGGGITERARKTSPLVAGFPVETSATAVIVSFGSWNLHCTLPAPIGMAMRDRFDAYLAEEAVRAGAELRDNRGVTGMELHDSSIGVDCGGETVAGSYVVGADGANGVTAKHAGFAPWKTPGAAVEVEIEVPERARTPFENALLLDLKAIDGGYGWIFGKADHLSVGLGVFRADRPRDLRAALSRFLASHPDLRGGKTLLQRGHLIPLAGGRSTRRKGRVLLAGDAAALADPLTAEGISYAIASGRRAGESILAALGGNGSPIDGYDRYIRHDLCGDLRYARIVAALSYRFPDVVARLAAEDTALRDADTGAVAGTVEYRSLVLTMVRKMPRLVRALATRDSLVAS